MILYENTIERFNEDVMQNAIADRAAEKYQAHYKRRPASSEYRSWAISLAILNNSFTYSGLKDNHIVEHLDLQMQMRNNLMNEDISKRLN